MKKQSSNHPPKSLLFVLSGPSGVGKDAVLAQMRALDVPLKYIVTVTTRPKRPMETDNVDYHFISIEEFNHLLESEDLFEHACVYGNYYGVPARPVREALAQGQDVIAKVDVQGAATIKKLMPQGIFIFLMPPSMEELAARLKKRRTESEEALKRRLETAQEEIDSLSMFDYVVINEEDKIDKTVGKIRKIISAEKERAG